MSLLTCISMGKAAKPRSGWLPEVRIGKHGSFNEAEMTGIVQIVSEKRDMLVEAWHEFFG